MTELAIAVDADDEMWTLDNLPTPEAPYVEVESELIEVRSRFPSSYYTLTGETLPPRIRVRRGIAGTTRASHIQGSTLTPNYGLGSGAGAGGVTVDNQSDPPTVAATLIVPGAVIVGDEATLPTKDFYAQDTDPGAVGAGSRWIDTSASPYPWYRRNATDTAWEPFGDIVTVATGAVQTSSQASSFAEDGIANAGSTAETTGAGNAQVDTNAYSQGAGAAFARSLAFSDGAGNAVVSPHANSNGDGNALAAPWAEAAGTGDADASSLASAVSGDAVAVSLAQSTTGQTQSGIRAVRGAVEASIVVTVLNDGTPSLIALGLPTADPAVAGQLWNDAGTLKVSAG